MNRYVLDAWSLMCFLIGEPSGKKVQNLLQSAAAGNEARIWVSWVNVVEVYYMTYRKTEETNRRLAALEALNIVVRLPLTIVQAGMQESLEAGVLKSIYSLGIADAYAAATAKIREAVVVTGDPDFKTLEENREVQVKWL